MNWLWMLLAVMVLGAVASEGVGQGAGKQEARAGWLGIFPDMQGYQRTFLAPVVGDGKPPKSYRQTAKYEWTGGAAKLLEVTVARDPAFEKQYAEETLKKDPGKPARVMIGKTAAWQWKLAKEGDKDFWATQARVVVPLAADRALILELKGPGPWEPLEVLAKRFDLDKVRKALESPPRTDFPRSLKEFQALKPGMTSGDITAWVGHADEAASATVIGGTGPLTYWLYRLQDGSAVHIGLTAPEATSLAQVIVTLTHETKDGKKVDLAK